MPLPLWWQGVRLALCRCQQETVRRGAPAVLSCVNGAVRAVRLQLLLASICSQLPCQRSSFVCFAVV